LHPALEQKYFDTKWAEISALLDSASLAFARTAGEKLSMDEATVLAFDSP